MARGQNKQLSFNLGLENFKSVDEIAAGENEAVRTILSKPEEWPGRIICIVGEQMAGAEFLATSWAKSNNAVITNSVEANEINIVQNIALIDADKFDESKLLNLFFNCESGKNYLLLVANKAPKLWAVNSADLRSRISAIPVLQLLPPTESNFFNVLSQSLAQIGVSVTKSEVADAIIPQIRSFSLIAKIFSHISMLKEPGTKITRAQLRLIFNEICANELSNDLFEERHDKSKNN